MPFHLADQVCDIDEPREFYRVKLSLSEEPSDSAWSDFSLNKAKKEALCVVQHSD